ncbi:DUF4403 family protein [Novosphingobium sp. SG720]|uniref:DUF4403 family protein n=1 Tax=Novosphingobium sp. SG720 TaxID=2586998 RepID=UPI001447F581|nr:DUF4403 family protein [Novosphingobium sp. SG720]NKJ41193.1 hypothetical protein [Novosphingobium sp. SG720]
MKRSLLIGSAVALAASIPLVACHHRPANQAPPRATDAISLPPQASTIAVPIVARLDELSAALEQAVPRELWSIDQPGQDCLASKRVQVLGVKIKTPRVECRVVGNVVRGPITLAGQGQDLVITLPMHATVRARDIAGVLKQETATGDAVVRAHVRLSLTRDWKPRATLDIHYDWTNAPGIDFLGQRITFTSKADAKLKGVIDKLERTLPSELDKLHLDRQIGKAWASAFTSLELNHANPPVWMRVTPKDLRYGGYAVEGRQLVLKMGMQAQTETFVGNRPPDPTPAPLPPLHTLDGAPGRMLFVIPVIADYRELEPVIARALVKRSARPFDVPGLGAVTAQFGKVTCYGTTGGKVAVGVQFAANGAHGTVWLTGTPVNAPNSRVVSFADLAVSGVTDSTGTDVLLSLANAPGLSETIAAALAQNFERDYAKLMAKIDRALTDKRTGDFVIRARIEDVRTGRLKAAGQGLYLPVEGTGTATVSLDMR